MLRLRQFASVILVTLLAAGPVHSATPMGVLKASVSSASGKPMADVQMRLISLDTGRTINAATNSAGLVAAELTPGLYTVNSASGYPQVSGPRVVSLTPGAVLSAALSFATPEQAPAVTAALTIDPPGCLVAGTYPRFEAVLTPADPTGKARLYFKGAGSTELFYVDMVPGAGNYLGTLPRPTVKASPITFYVEVIGANGTTRTAESQAVVVEKELECAGRKLAPVAASGPATAIGATGVAGLPAGFGAGAAIGGAAAGAAAGGGILGLGTTTALIIGGGILAGGVILVANNNNNASPSK